MLFSNLMIYRLPVNWTIGAQELSAAMESNRFVEPGSTEPASCGWVPPTNEGEYVHAVGKHWLVCMQTGCRVLPGWQVKQELDERAAAIEASRGFGLGRKERKDLKCAIIEELLPKAPVKLQKLFAWIDPAGGTVALNTSSRKVGDEFVSLFAGTFSPCTLSLVRTIRELVPSMSTWLAAGEGPELFSIDMDCELRTLGEDQARVRYVNHMLDGADIQDHLQAGKVVTSLGLTFDDAVSFVLTQDFVLKGLKFTDVVAERASSDETDPVGILDAQFTLMTETYSRLIAQLCHVLGGMERMEAGDLADEAESISDELYEEAVTVTRELGQYHAGHIKASLNVSIARAQRLVERMQANGVLIEEQEFA